SFVLCADDYRHLRSFPTRRSSDLDLLAATLCEHHVVGQVLGDGPLYHVVFTDRPVQTYRDTLTANAQQHRVFHNELLNHGVLKRSEEHTSELQSRGHLVCRLLLEK